MPELLPSRATTRTDGQRVTLNRFRPDMRTEGRVYADRALFDAMVADETLVQLANVATLPGLVGPVLAMPDAHQGYGFPIGGVAATDAEPGGEGVVSPGGVGFDINCGVRLLRTDLEGPSDRELDALCTAIFARVPVGFDKSGELRVSGADLDPLLEGGARWAVERGYGDEDDLAVCEEEGAHPGADAEAVSSDARKRGAGQVGTLGSGNHFVEVQIVDEILHAAAAEAFGLRVGQVVVLIHTGSRGLGHQVCTETVQAFQKVMKRYDIELPDRQLACAPVHSPEGQRYLAAMAGAANFAWANRQVITHRVRQALGYVFGEGTGAQVVYDVAHNMAKIEQHPVDGQLRALCVHRKGATRAFGPGRPEIPERYRAIGQPAFIPGSMGTASYVIAGTERAMTETWGSVCHGAGRALSRTAAKKRVTADEVIRDLKARGITIRAGSKAGIVEEFPGAYKDVHSVIDVVANAGLADPVARLVPRAVIKG